MIRRVGKNLALLHPGRGGVPDEATSLEQDGYAVVRAASGGISALVSPRGEVIASCDHVLDGPKLVHGLLPTGDGQATWYARLGNVPMLVVAVALLLGALLRRGRG